MVSKQESVAEKKRQSPARTAIVVLGMHRSGTSAASRVLNLLGCDLPANVMGPSDSNTAGHWESQEIYKLNNRILESAGSNWQDWEAVNQDWFTSARAEEFKDEAAAVIENEFGKSRLFVLKDPRICRLMPFWTDVLASMEIAPKVIVPLRNPMEVAASLEARNGFPSSFGQLLWLRHTLDAERFSRGMPRYFFNYEDLLSNWAGVMEKAKPALDIGWPRLSAQVTAEIEEFLSDKLRHHSVSRESVVANPTLSEWLRGTYDTLARWGEDGEHAEGDAAALDTIRQSLDTAAPAFASVVASGMKAVSLHRALARKQDDLSAERDRAVNQGATLSAELEDLRRESNEERAKAGEALATAERDRTELRDRLSQTESALEQRRHESEETAEALKAKQAELEALQSELEALKAEKAENEAAAAGKDDTIAELGEANAELRREIEQRIADIAKAEAALDESARRAEEVAASLAAREAELEALTEELQALRQEKIEAEAAVSEGERISIGLKEHIELLMEDVKKVEASLEQRRHAGDKVSDTKQAYERELQQLKADLETAIGEKRSQEAAIVEKETVIAENGKAIAEKEKVNTGLKEHVHLLMGDVGRMESEVEQLKAQKQAAETARRASEAIWHEVNRVIAAMLVETGGPLMPRAMRIKRKMARFEATGLFDRDWYLKENPDVAQSGMDPLRHYVQYGAREGRAPNARLKGPGGH